MTGGYRCQPIVCFSWNWENVLWLLDGNHLDTEGIDVVIVHVVSGFTTPDEKNQWEGAGIYAN